MLELIPLMPTLVSLTGPSPGQMPLQGVRLLSSFSMPVAVNPMSGIEKNWVTVYVREVSIRFFGKL